MRNRKPVGRRKFLKSTAAAIGAGQFWQAGMGALADNPQTEVHTRKGRQTLSLDGEWEIDDSVSPDQVPTVYRHRVPVPGLAHLATPAFPDVDQFESRENVANLTQGGEVPGSTWDLLGEDGVGISKQERNYFWYRKQFRVPERRGVVLLKVNKAQFGTAVWLNGAKIGEHLGCFTAALFDVTKDIQWGGENQLVVRVGAHPGVLPKGAPAGTDFEKRKWTPGIYDSVSVMLSDNPIIETVQIAPCLHPSEILVQVKVKNYGLKSRTFDLSYHVSPWKSQAEVASSSQPRQELKPGEVKTLTQTIPVPGAKLWSPDAPFLYTLKTSTGGDSSDVRFGMREFRFDTATKRAYLNGKPYFLRGSNITLHRFFEDPKSGSLPWDEKWVRKLLIEIPKKMHWNSFRFCIGPVPDRWLDIADEAGLLIQNEFFVWTGQPEWYSRYKGRHYDAEEMIRQYGEWMRDNWNHPSVAIWDANNETLDDIFADKIIPAVRSLDLSNRSWENSYNGPEGSNDPVEDHPYLFFFDRTFTAEKLETMPGLSANTVTPTAHAMILNEYDTAFLNRDGSFTEIGKRYFDRFFEADSTAEEKFELQAYLIGGLTEFWRAYRNYAGVLYFVYLTCSYPGTYTSDNFRNVETLQLEPRFKNYVSEAFKPLGVYINFWHPTVEAGSKRRFCVMMINDEYQEVKGNLALSMEGEDGKEVLCRELPFSIPGLGQQTYTFDIEIPDAPGKFLLKATASHTGPQGADRTISRRKLSIAAKSS
jgi:hypothetical protein